MTTQAIIPTEAPAALDLALDPALDAEYKSTFRQESKAGKTVRDYKSHWAAFEFYCGLFGYVAMPATAGIVERFIDAQAKGKHTGKDDTGAYNGQPGDKLSVSTIQARLAAIGFIHEAAGQPNPTKTIGVRSAMQGIRRSLGVAPTKKVALTIDEIRKAVAVLGDDLRGKRDRAMLLAGYFGAFRRSELVALTAAQLRFEREQTRVTISKSKTDQEGRGKFKHLPVLADELADICPTRALRSWLDAAGIGSGPVFVGIDRWGHPSGAPMTGKEVARLVKRVVELTGLSAKDFAGHSLRSGFVTDATRAGAADSEIMEMTGHTSRQTVDEYRQMHGAGALSAAHKVAGLAK